MVLSLFFFKKKELWAGSYFKNEKISLEAFIFVMVHFRKLPDIFWQSLWYHSQKEFFFDEKTTYHLKEPEELSIFYDNSIA